MLWPCVGTSAETEHEGQESKNMVKAVVKLLPPLLLCALAARREKKVVHTQARTHTHTHTHTHTQTHTHTPYTNTHTHTHTQTHVHHPPTHTNTRTHTIHTHTHTHKRTQTKTHTHSLTLTHTHEHTLTSSMHQVSGRSVSPPPRNGLMRMGTSQKGLFSVSQKRLSSVSYSESHDKSLLHSRTRAHTHLHFTHLKFSGHA
jgi:hypothetical protein